MTHEEDQPVAARLAYEKPRLVFHGQVEDVTEGGSPNIFVDEDIDYAQS